MLHTNFFKINNEKFRQFEPYFEDVFTTYENSTDEHQTIASVKLLALLYHLKEFTTAFNQWETGFSTPQQILLQKFIQLINNFYIEKRTIEEYSELLHITPNYLSQSIKQVSGKNALSFINERLLSEAKSLVLYTDFNIAEIAYQLNFSDPANFGKFFKKQTGLTPHKYRESKNKKG